jgi:serine/threonine-protein kinase HipA
LLRAQPQQTGHEVFRRMVFNILVGNVGDHLGNHGFIRISQNEYQLSPAFDMVPHLDAPLFSQAIGVGEAGAESTLANAMSQLGRFYLIPKLANQIIEQVRAVISTWREEFKRAGMTPADIATLAPCFAAADAREKIYMPPPPPPGA